MGLPVLGGAVQCVSMYYDPATKQQVTIAGGNDCCLRFFHYPDASLDCELDVQDLLREFGTVTHTSQYRPKRRARRSALLITEVSYVDHMEVDGVLHLMCKADGPGRTTWVALNHNTKSIVQVKQMRRMNARIKGSLAPPRRDPASGRLDFFPDDCAAFAELWGNGKQGAHPSSMTTVAMRRGGACVVTACNPIQNELITILSSSEDEFMFEDDAPDDSSSAAGASSSAAGASSGAAGVSGNDRALLVWQKTGDGWTPSHSLPTSSDDKGTTTLLWDDHNDYIIVGTRAGGVYYHRMVMIDGTRGFPHPVRTLENTPASPVRDIVCQQQNGDRVWYAAYEDGTRKAVRDDTFASAAVVVDFSGGAAVAQQQSIVCMALSPFNAHVAVGRNDGTIDFFRTNTHTPSEALETYWESCQAFLYSEYTDTLTESERTFGVDQYRDVFTRWSLDATGAEVATPVAFPKWYFKAEGRSKADICAICQSDNFQCPVAMQVQKADGTLEYTPQIICGGCMRELVFSVAPGANVLNPFDRRKITRLRFLSEQELELRMGKLPEGSDTSASSSSYSSSCAYSSGAAVPVPLPDPNVARREEIRRLRAARFDPSSSSSSSSSSGSSSSSSSSGSSGSSGEAEQRAQKRRKNKLLQEASKFRALRF